VIRHFFAFVPGETDCNADPSGRHALYYVPGETEPRSVKAYASVPQVDFFERVVLEPEPDNPHDRNAIRVLRRSGEQLGYLPRVVGAEVVSGTANGWRYHGVVVSWEFVRGFTPYGVRLLIVAENENATDEAIDAYRATVSGSDPARPEAESKSDSDDEITWIEDPEGRSKP